MGRFQWKPGKSPTQAMAPGIARYKSALRRAIWGVLNLNAAEIETDMKRNAPWTDQTANARQTLRAFVYEPRPEVVALVAKQHMEYGKWLELKNGGRYAIILPTLEQYYQQVWSDIKDVVE